MKIGQHYTPATFAIFQRMADLAVEIRRDLDAIDRTPVLNRIEDRVCSIQVLLRDVIMKDAKVVPAIPNHDFDDPSDVAECMIVGRLVRDLLAAGYTLSVYDGEEETVSFATKEEPIFEALASTDQDVLYANKGAQRSFVSLVWGNGVDVISDYTMSLEYVLKGANDLAQELDA